MSISYSWQIEDMKWDNASGTVVSVNAKYIGTYNGKVGSATTTITESRIKILELNTSSSPSVSIDSLTPGQVKGWLNTAYEFELPTIKLEISKVLKEKEEQFIHEQMILTYSSQDWKYYRPAGISSDRILPNSTWSGEPEVGK